MSRAGRCGDPAPRLPVRRKHGSGMAQVAAPQTGDGPLLEQGAVQ